MPIGTPAGMTSGSWCGLVGLRGTGGGVRSVGGVTDNKLFLPGFGAVCGVVLALSIGVPGAVEAFTGETALTSAVIGLGTAFGAPAVLAFHGHQAHASGRFGAFAFAANMIGLGCSPGWRSR